MTRYSFNFVDFKIISINFSLTGKSPQEIDIKPSLEFRHEKNKNELKVYLGINYENPKAPFVFNIKGAGLFEFENDISKEDLEEVANINCAAILYPFLRETLADITRRSGLPPLLLPPLNFINLYKVLKKERELAQQEH